MFSDVVVHDNARQLSRELSPLLERDVLCDINRDFGVSIFPVEADVTDADTCGKSKSDSYVTDLVTAVSDATRATATAASLLLFVTVPVYLRSRTFFVLIFGDCSFIFMM